MTNISETVISVVQDTLNSINSESGVIGIDDSMQTIATWDSLAFMAVFTAINDSYSITPNFDDAIHYISVRSIVEFVNSNVTQNAA